MEISQTLIDIRTINLSKSLSKYGLYDKDWILTNEGTDDEFICYKYINGKKKVRKVKLSEVHRMRKCNFELKFNNIWDFLK